MSRVSIKGITKVYGKGQPAVDNLSLDINDGEFFALLGPSGSGKTTILRCLAGFEEINEGEIYFGNEQIDNVSIEKRGVGMVFQNYALFPHMTVEENVSFGLKQRKVPKNEIKKQVKEVLQKLGIYNFKDRYPTQLSGGQQQRVAIARVLVIKPKVMLLDEPLANLDAKLREEMRYYIRSLQREIGITTIFVTHDQLEALELADRVGVMFDGELHDVSEPEELYRKPKSRKVAEFIGTTNLIDGLITKKNGDEVKVDSDIGTLYSSAPENSNVGDEVSISIRPEDVKMKMYSEGDSSQENGEKNGLIGKVIDNIFLGSITEYRVSVETNTGQNKVLLVHHENKSSVQKGTNVHISFRPEDGWVIL